MLALALDFGEPWIRVRDGNAIAYNPYSRHYTFARGLIPLCMGPGEKLLLVTPAGDAVFAWRKFIDDSGQLGVNCAIFRNEGRTLSSDLIRAADRAAWEHWPNDARHYTYVNPRRVRSTNPGYCFLQAGWRKCGVSRKRKLLIFECQPSTR